MADETNEGIAAFGALTDQERKTQAYNALNRAYGPAIADDPTNAFNAAKASVAGQTIPTEVQQAGANLSQTQAQTAGLNASTAGKNLENADTAGTQNRMAAYRAAQMLKSTAGPDGSIPPDAYDKIVRPNAALFGIDPDHVDQFGQMLAAPNGASQLDQISQALIGPTKVTGAATYGVDANGQPVAIVKDQFGNFHQQSLNGTTPTQVTTAQSGQTNAQTNQKKLPIAQQNADANTYRANTTSNNSNFGNPGGALPQRGAPIAPAAADTAPTSPAVTHPDALFNRLPPKGKNAAIGQATQIVNQGTNLANTNTILDQVQKQISPYTAGTGSLLSKLPGTAQTDLKANLATLKAQGLMTWISSLKNAGGQTGIGRVLQSEANAATNLYGNMEQDQSAKQLAFHAQLFRNVVNSLYQHTQASFQAQYGLAPHEALGVDAPVTSSNGATPADPNLAKAYKKYGL